MFFGTCRGDCGPPRRFHVSFENWLTGSPWTEQWLVDLEPYGTPVDLGDMGSLTMPKMYQNVAAPLLPLCCLFAWYCLKLQCLPGSDAVLSSLEEVLSLTSFASGVGRWCCHVLPRVQREVRNVRAQRVLEYRLG